ncbi:MAG: D-tyrosyl-tRNA(Tyr) deacylase [Ruminococcaceae bacterium]|nr:D-tyrosyl-tRNA(Tyr) deacylase [Oscillospiraceae bacterium]
MKIVLQRVNHASVKVDNEITGKIDKGYLLLVGVGEGDTKEMADKLIDKISKLRIFPDENDKINLSIADVDGSVLVVSQFTLYADCKKGNRPSFTLGAKPDFANEMYEYILKECERKFKKVEKGIFGADMKVSLENDGPFTLILEA